MILFTAASANAITPDEWRKLINDSENFDVIPNGEVAVLTDCDVKTDKYRILFGAFHGVRFSGPNMLEVKGNKFVIILGAGENGYTGMWGYEIFTEPRVNTFFATTLRLDESVRPIWFMKRYQISAKKFAEQCSNYVPYDPMMIGQKTWDSDAGKPIK
jgi:hypothetical protein